MKVITEGEPILQTRYRTTCQGCESVLEAIKNELKWSEDFSSFSGKGKCPRCYSKVYFRDPQDRVDD